MAEHFHQNRANESSEVLCAIRFILGLLLLISTSSSPTQEHDVKRACLIVHSITFRCYPRMALRHYNLPPPPVLPIPDTQTLHSPPTQRATQDWQTCKYPPLPTPLYTSLTPLQQPLDNYFVSATSRRHVVISKTVWRKWNSAFWISSLSDR